MTYKEKYIREHPNAPMRSIDGYPYGCPEDRSKAAGTGCPLANITCKECWDRRIQGMSDDGQRLTAVMIVTGVLAILTAAAYLIWGW